MAEVRRTVLVVEDDPDVLLLCQIHLEFEGYDVRGASDGLAGLAAARMSTPDVILLDVMLPGLDGWQLLREFRADPDLAPVPVVMLTATSDRADQRRAWHLGADDYVIKPFAPATLTHVLQDVLASTPEQRAHRRSRLLEPPR